MKLWLGLKRYGTLKNLRQPAPFEGGVKLAGGDPLRGRRRFRPRSQYQIAAERSHGAANLIARDNIGKLRRSTGGPRLYSPREYRG